MTLSLYGAKLKWAISHNQRADAQRCSYVACESAVHGYSPEKAEKEPAYCKEGASLPSKLTTRDYHARFGAETSGRVAASQVAYI